MIKHLFKLLWSQRKSNFLIMLEIFVAFIILFALGSLGSYFYSGYVKPSGFSTDNVWVMYVDYNTEKDSVRWQNMDLLRQRIKSFTAIKTFSFSSFSIPYGFGTSNGETEHNGRKVQTEYIETEDTYPSVLDMKIIEGTWFKNNDTMQKAQPVVITQSLKEAFWGNESAVGKRFGGNDPRWQVVGVVEAFKNKNEFQTQDYVIFSAIGKGASRVLLKVDPSVNADFEAEFAKSIQNLGKDWVIEILHMDDTRTQANSIIVIPMTILLIVCGFLILNVMLGLFGVLFQNITRRRNEIGIRRALGATGNAIAFQFVAEMLILATFAISIGLFFAVQFPLLKIFDVSINVYLGGILIATLAIYALVLLCAWLPSRQAAAILPATALHEE